MEGIQLSVETGMSLGKEQVTIEKKRQGLYNHKHLCGYIFYMVYALRCLVKGYKIESSKTGEVTTKLETKFAVYS